MARDTAAMNALKTMSSRGTPPPSADPEISAPRAATPRARAAIRLMPASASSVASTVCDSGSSAKEKADRSDQQQVDDQLGAQAPSLVGGDLDGKCHRGQNHEGTETELGGDGLRRRSEHHQVGEPRQLPSKSGCNAGEQQEPRGGVLAAVPARLRQRPKG